VSLALQPLAVRVGDAVGQLLLSDQERASGMRVAMNLESLVRGFGLELSEALSPYVLGGIMSRSEARRTRTAGPPRRRRAVAAGQRRDGGSSPAAPGPRQRPGRGGDGYRGEFRHCRIADRALDGLRPLAVDVAGGQLESAGVVSRLEDGREAAVDLADIRKALAAEPPVTADRKSDPILEAAE
jgi:hypothetical protein